MLLDKLRELSLSAPLQPAVVADSQVLSYVELERRSSRVAAYLAQAGIAQDSLVAIYTNRDINSIVALFAVLKVGAAYTFVEDDGVREENYHRLTAIAADAVLCAAVHLEPLRELGLRPLDMHGALLATALHSAVRVKRDTNAYVLFTSGSTGIPKGVAVSHGNIQHYTESVSQRFVITRPLNYAHVSTLAADLGNTSLFLSLSSGGCLHLLSVEQRKDPAAFRDYLQRQRIDFLKITPSHWNAMFPAEQPGIELPQLEYLVFGGEALPKKLARRVLESGRIAQLFNHYGPTETTVGFILGKQKFQILLIINI